jgi:hypothetical protein
MRLRNSVSSASGTFTRKGRIPKLLPGGAALAPVALVAFAPCAVIADASLIFLRKRPAQETTFLLPQVSQIPALKFDYLSNCLAHQTLFTIKINEKAKNVVYTVIER